MFYLENEMTGKLAGKGCTGSHNAIEVESCLDAASFDNSEQAWDFSQNFGPEWSVIKEG